MRVTQIWTVISLALTLVLSLVVCGRWAQRPEDRTAMQEPGLYEIFWVDPQIIYADTLMTLIRSERIDSSRIDPAELSTHQPAAIAIRVYQSSCNVAVGLHDSSLRLIRPLLVRNLPAGFYRLTLHHDRFREPSLPPGRYFLKEDYCGRTEMATFSVP
ncbi:MAG: hypothetical protein AB1772_06125 [Candidatus Zixiibacteriota bacterium]